MKYVSVAIENTSPGMDILYTYSCSDDGIRAGDGVSVPFGTRNGSRKGFVFEVKEDAGYRPEKIKEVISVEKGVLSEEAIFLCHFLKRRYLCRYIDAVKCFLPSGYFLYENTISLGEEGKAKAFLSDPKSPKRQVALIRILLERGWEKKSVLKNAFGIDYSVMRAVVKKGLAVPGRIEKKRRPHTGVKPDRESFLILTEEQRIAVNRIREAMAGEKPQTFLLHGVTGSGKTRVYMEAIREALRQGKSAVVLVPEISLTIQGIEKFRGEFGEENVAILHSKLSEGERYDEWMRMKRGEAKIVLGARSAIFAPLEKIGVIVVDEEQETSYKADHAPKYDTRELAEARAGIHGALLILGSATPSVTTYHRWETGEIQKLTLKKRYNETPLPRIEIADMREELKAGNKSIFSLRLYEEMTRCLNSGKQVILFLNRRGYSSFVSCRSCGHVLKCPECGVALTYHKSEHAAVCHYCGRRMPTPRNCPACGSGYIKDFGIGTERVEEFTRKLFPKASVARLDLDTVRKKGSAEAVLSDFKQGRTNILIGTQLVAKGLDFINVDLVGMIAADISMNIPDYRAGERTFQLILQAAGRAGRGTEQGHVVVQTYAPEHFALTAAAAQDYQLFYDEEIQLRRMLSYPPFSEIIQLTFLDETEERALSCGEAFCRRLTDCMGGDFEKQLLGPKPTHIAKIGGRYRYQVLIKYKDNEVEDFMALLEQMKTDFIADGHRNSSIGIDRNPYSLG